MDALARAFAVLRAGGAHTVIQDVTPTQQSSGEQMLANLSLASALVLPSTWLVVYEGTGLPSGSWLSTVRGTPTLVVTGASLRLVGDVDNSVCYAYELPTLDALRGTTVEIKVQLAASVTDTVDHGLGIGIHDGTYLAQLWLRPDGLNIDGYPNVSCLLSAKQRTVRFSSQRGRCQVAVDELKVTSGQCMQPTDSCGITFGNAMALSI